MHCVETNVLVNEPIMFAISQIDFLINWNCSCGPFAANENWFEVVGDVLSIEIHYWSLIEFDRILCQYTYVNAYKNFGSKMNYESHF